MGAQTADAAERTESQETETDATDDGAFRRDVRAWVAEHLPPALRGCPAPAFHASPEELAANLDNELWRRRVADQGWGVPTWPKALGGGGLEPAQARVIEEEFARAGAYNPIRGLGVMMFGPTLLEYGTPEQIARHIPPIARGELRWCQGFSEPGAGSDLASLRTAAEDHGDHWIVRGQKLWTSGANHADWCFCLVRTDTTRKQDGITFVMIDMRSPGVEARPIRLINGVSHFCEVFFEDVAVPKENTVGAVDAGWGIAKRLLQHERSGLSVGRAADEDLAPLAKRYLGVDAEGRIADADLRARLIAHAARKRAYGLTIARATAEARAGLPDAPSISAVKNLGASIAQERAELMVEILGSQALGDEGGDFAPEELTAASDWLYSKCFSIYGGSHEVQNNIIAKRVLGLPSLD